MFNHTVKKRMSPFNSDRINENQNISLCFMRGPKDGIGGSTKIVTKKNLLDSKRPVIL